MNSGIYALVNKQNGKRYIGRSIDLEKREKTHLWMLKNNRHPNVHLQRAWNLGERFDFEIIEQCDPDRCNEREVYWIAFFDAMNMKKGYNLCEGGQSTTGYHFTEEGKRKISKANSGRKCTKEAIEKRVAGLKKHMEDDPEFAEEIRERCRKLAYGGWNKGRKATKETRQKLSEALKGRYVSPEHKEKLRNLYSGEKSITAKLKQSDVVKMRYRFLCGEKRLEIAKDYPQMSPQTIYDIVVGNRWKCVPMEKEQLKIMLEEQENGL